MILLVVDTQKLIMKDDLFNFDELVLNIKRLIFEARENDCEVIFVRHDNGELEALSKGKDGYEIYDQFKPMNDEKIFDKNVNSVFKASGLLEYLKEKDESEIIMVGIQSDKCMDACVKSGFEHNFKVIIPAYTHSTIDNEYMNGEESYKYYNDFIWNHRYAECVSMEDAIKRIQKK